MIYFNIILLISSNDLIKKLIESLLKQLSDDLANTPDDDELCCATDDSVVPFGHPYGYLLMQVHCIAHYTATEKCDRDSPNLKTINKRLQ